jgi:hypothetical protein
VGGRRFLVAVMAVGLDVCHFEVVSSQFMYASIAFAPTTILGAGCHDSSFHTRAVLGRVTKPSRQPDKPHNVTIAFIGPLNET